MSKCVNSLSILAVAETTGESVIMTERTQRSKELQQALHNELNRKLKHRSQEQTTSVSTHGEYMYTFISMLLQLTLRTHNLS